MASFMLSNESCAAVVRCGETGLVYSSFVVRLQSKVGQSKFKLRYELAVELGKPNDFCNVMDSLWLGPVFKDFML